MEIQRPLLPPALTPATTESKGQGTDTAPLSNAARNFLEAMDAAQIKVSKHSRSRVKSSGVDGDIAARLTEGLALAKEKGMQKPAILIDDNTFILDMREREIKMVTVVPGERERGGFFNNIDGLVRG